MKKSTNKNKFFSKGILIVTFLLFLLITALIGIPAPIINFGIVYNIGILPLGSPIVVIYSMIIAYAILKHRLLDITVIIGRTAAYVITIILFGVGYLLLTLAYVNLFSSKVDFGFLGMTIVYGILVGEFFQRVRFLVQTTAEKAFLKGKYDYRKILSRMSGKLTGCKTMGDIRAVLEGDFREEVECKSVKLLLKIGQQELKAGCQELKAGLTNSKFASQIML